MLLILLASPLHVAGDGDDWYELYGDLRFRLESDFDSKRADGTERDDRTRARLIERLGETVRIVVDDERSQLRNRELANQRLRARILSALHREKPRRKTRPSRSSQRKRVEGKRRRSRVKEQRRRPRMDD